MVEAVVILAIPIGIIIWLCTSSRMLVTEPVDSDILKLISEDLTVIQGNPVSVGFAGKDGYDCIIDFQDGTLGLGMGDTTYEAYVQARDGERYLGTTGL